MSRARRPDTPIAALVRLAWQSPLVALPFAGFFMLLMGQGRGQFLGYWLASLVFAGLIGLLNWVVRWFVGPRLSQGPDDPRAMLKTGLAHAGASLLGSWLAAILLDRTIAHGMLGSARAFATFTMFSLIFTALFLGLATAWHLWQRAVDRLKSEQELQLARRIQSSFLPSSFPRRASSVRSRA